jgi:hypothetical protein
MLTTERRRYDDSVEIYIQFKTSVHWSHDPVSINFNSRGNEEWHIRYSSGGTLAAEPEEIAQAMKVIFSKAEELMKYKIN